MPAEGERLTEVANPGEGGYSSRPRRGKSTGEGGYSSRSRSGEVEDADAVKVEYSSRSLGNEGVRGDAGNDMRPVRMNMELSMDERIRAVCCSKLSSEARRWWRSTGVDGLEVWRSYDDGGACMGSGWTFSPIGFLTSATEIWISPAKSVTLECTVERSPVLSPTRDLVFELLDFIELHLPTCFLSLSRPKWPREGRPRR